MHPVDERNAERYADIYEACKKYQKTPFIRVGYFARFEKQVSDDEIE